MKDFFLKNLDKINFALILVLFVYIISSEFRLSQSTFVKNRSDTTNTESTNTYTPKIVNMRDLISRGFRAQFKIISVNGKSFSTSDEALVAIRTHDLNHSDLKIIFKDDTESTKTIVFSASP